MFVGRFKYSSLVTYVSEHSGMFPAEIYLMIGFHSGLLMEVMMGFPHIGIGANWLLCKDPETFYR